MLEPVPDPDSSRREGLLIGLLRHFHDPDYLLFIHSYRYIVLERLNAMHDVKNATAWGRLTSWKRELRKLKEDGSRWEELRSITNRKLDEDEAFRNLREEAKAEDNKEA